MIKMIYDPILGVRYITVNEPMEKKRKHTKRRNSILEKYNRKRATIRTKQASRTNTKSK